MRAFVSVDCDPLADEIRERQDPLRDVAGLRLVDPANTHVTLKFLGDVPTGRVSAVREALSEAVASTGLAPFDLRLGGYGAFPSSDYISVVWLGVQSGGSELTRLQEAVETRLVELGFDAEDHDFTPHVTIARMDHAAGKDHVQRLLGEPATGTTAMRVEHVSLTESTLTKEGPVYSTVASIPL